MRWNSDGPSPKLALIVFGASKACVELCRGLNDYM